MFSTTFFLPSKVIIVFVRKLSGLLCYIVKLFTHNLLGMFSTKKIPKTKLIMVFLSRLSGMQCLSYHAIRKNKLPGIFMLAHTRLYVYSLCCTMSNH